MNAWAKQPSTLTPQLSKSPTVADRTSLTSGRVLTRPKGREVLTHPVDRLVQSLVQRVRRLPPPELAGQVRARHEAAYLTRWRPYPLLVGLDLDFAVEPLANSLDQLTDREVVATSDVDDLAERCIASGDRHETTGRVFDVSQVAPGVEAPQLDHRVWSAPG